MNRQMFTAGEDIKAGDAVTTNDGGYLVRCTPEISARFSTPYPLYSPLKPAESKGRPWLGKVVEYDDSADSLFHGDW